MKKALLSWLCVVLFAASANIGWSQSETCALASSATPLAVGASCSSTAFTMTSFATEMANPACATSVRDGWWRFTTGAGTQSVTISETTNRPIALAVYTGCNTTDMIACQSFGSAAGSISINVSPSTTYYLRVMRTNAGVNAWTGSVCVVGSNSSIVQGCTTAGNGQYPLSTYTPTCNGVANSIATDCYAGEYSVVALTNGVSYTFSSSNTTDFITISNSGGTTVLASGTSSVTWTSTLTGNVRFYTHTNSYCGEAAVNRSRRVQCGVVAPPPANDNCASATSITPGATCVATNGTTASATQQFPATTCDGSSSTSANDVWYTFTANGTSSYIVSATTVAPNTNDIVLGLYSGCASGSLISCTDLYYYGTESINAGQLAAGTYYYRVYGVDGASVAFTTCVTMVTPPANDNCANATALTLYPTGSCTSTAGTTVNASFQGGALPTCDNFGSIQDVWYSFNSGSNTALNFNVTLGTAENVGIEFFTACGTPATGLSANCDFNAATPSPTSITGFTTNTNYLFRLFTNVTYDLPGTFDVCITMPPPPPSNDLICGAIPLTVGTTTTPTFTAATNVNATDGSQGVGICWDLFSAFANDVWYSAQVPASGNVVAAINPSSALSDMLLEIFTSSNNTCTGTLTTVACNDDAGAGLRPFAYSHGLTPGSTVFIRASSYDAGSAGEGTFGIAVTDAIHWTGATSGSPAVSTNWFGNPDIDSVYNTKDIRVLNVPNVMTPTANLNVLDVYMNDGASVAMNGGNLRVNGDWHGGSSASPANVTGVSNDILVFLSNNGIIDGYTNVQRMRVNGNAYTISAGSNHVYVSSVMQATSGVLTTNGNITFLSGPTGTAVLQDFGTNIGTVSGNINMQRYNPIGVTGYRQLGTPVAMPNISGVSGFTVSGVPGMVIPLSTCDPNYVAANSPYGSWVQLVENGALQYNCSQSLFQVLTSGGMTNGRGYYMDAAGGSTFTFTGQPNTGIVNFPVTHTAANTAVANGWNMVSNPFPSPLLWETIGVNIPAGIDAIAKLWVTSGTYQGTWQDLDPSASGTQAVAIGQAFQVRVTIPGTTIPFLVDNLDRTTIAPSYLFAGGDPMTLNIDILGNGFADVTKVRFIDGATASLDANFDSPKMLGNANQPMVYSIWNNQNYSTNSYGALDEVYALPLGVKIATSGSHTLQFSNVDQFPASALIYLEDLTNGAMQDIRANDTYPFTQTAGDITNRFILHFYPPVEKAVQDATCEVPGQVTLTEESPSTWTYELENTQSVTVSQGTLDASQTISNLPAGDYTLTLTHSTGYIAIETVTVTGAQQVMATAQVSLANVEAGQQIQFTGTTQNATAWDWNFGDGNTSTEQNPIHIYNAAGSYTATLVASNGNCDQTSQVSVSAYSTASIEDNMENAGVKMWNDNTMVYLNFQEQWIGKTIFTLYDITGKKVFQQTISNANGTQSIDCGILAAGTYTAEVKNANKAASRKVVMGTK